MIKGTEIRVIIHYNDDYFGRIEICDNPDAPENSTNIDMYEDNKKIYSMMIPDELLTDFINALQIYQKNKGK